MTIKDALRAEVLGRVVEVVILARGTDEQKVLNAFVDSRLLLLKDAGIVQWYSNKYDRFVVMPQHGWQPAELLIEVKRQLDL